MEIIGKNIPLLQTAITSGFESVAAGINEATQLNGPASIRNAFDSFSPANIGTPGAQELLPFVADVAQFSDPIGFFQVNSQSSVPATSNFIPHEFVGILKDQNFSVVHELSEIEKKMEQLKFNLFKKTPLQTGGESMTENYNLDPKPSLEKANPQSGTSTAADQQGIIVVGGKVPGSDKLDHLNAPPEPIIPHPEPAQLTGSGSTSTADAVFYKPIFKGAADQQNKAVQDAMEKAKQQYIPKKPEHLNADNPVNMYGPGGKSPGERLNDLLDRWKKLMSVEMNGTAKQSETMKKALEPNLIQGTADQTEAIRNASERAGGGSLGALLWPKAEYAPKEPEYLEGQPKISKPEAGSSSNADQRGIIIVGGKSSGTYFETIDDTLVKVNQNPNPETVQLLQQQVGALKDMSQTVQQSIQMNQQINSSITGKFRV